MRKMFLGVLVGVILGIGATTFAINKVATLVPPADYTSGGWSIRIYPQSLPGVAATSWCAETSFVATDSVNNAKDVNSHTICTPTPPADVVNFINARLAQARAANGY